MVYLRPSVNAIHQHLSDLWTCVAGWFQPFFTSSSHIPSATEETHFPEPTPQNIDDLLKRLKKIDAGMADLKRLVAIVLPCLSRLILINIVHKNSLF